MISEYKNTNSELAILGLLAEKPVYGYEVDQIVAKRGMRQWTEIGFSSIYHILKKLEENRLLKSETRDSGSRPARRVFEITALGMGILHDEVLHRLTAPRPHSSDMDLVLANMILLQPDEILDGLRKQHLVIIQRLDQVQAKWRSDRQDANFPAHVNELFDHSCHLLKAEIEWLEMCIHRFEEKDMPSSQP